MDRGLNRAAPDRRGTAVLELAILLPVYVLLAYGILYLGYIGLILEEGAELTHYAVMAPGSQAGTTDGQFYDAGYEGEYELTDATDKSDVFSGENPTSGNDEFDVHDILVELSYTFWGGFVVSAGKLEWQTEGGKNWIGSHIDRWRIMEENEATAWMMNGYVYRSTAEVKYDYTPYFIPAVNQKDLLTKEVDEGMEWKDLEIKSVNQAMVRGEKERPLGEDFSGENIYELSDKFPEGGGNRLPGYPGFGGSGKHWVRK